MTYSMQFDGAACDQLFDAETDAEALEEFALIVEDIDTEAESGTLELIDDTGRVLARHTFY